MSTATKTKPKPEPRAKPKRTKAKRAQIMRRRAVVAVLGLVTVGVLLFTVFPTRTYLQQRQDIRTAEQQLKLLKKANTDLTARANKLQTPEEVERIAREQYNMVKPGEQAFGLLPSAQPAETTESSSTNAASKPSTWSRVVNSITFWN